MLQQVIIAAVVAAGFVLLTGPFFIPELHKLKFGQSIREEGPKSHQAKSGTPTMGGIMIIGGITLATLVAAPWSTEVLLALFIMLGHFVLGFLDDYIKVVKKRNLGLKARQKLAGQILIAVVTMYIGTQVLGIDTGIWIPGANIDIDLGWLYYPLVLFVLVGTSNAVNLTDGLDGLASGEMAIAGSAFAVVSVLSGHPDLALFCVAIAAACLGFPRARRRARGRRHPDAYGAPAHRHRLRLCLRSALCHHPGHLVPDDGQARVPHEPDPSSFRARRLVGMEGRHGLLARGSPRQRRRPVAHAGLNSLPLWGRCRANARRRG